MLLSACSTTNTVPILQKEQKTKLELTKPKPLKLTDVKWKIIEKDGKPFFVVDAEGYSILAKNFEELQNRLWLDHNIILKYQEYYEGK